MSRPFLLDSITFLVCLRSGSAELRDKIVQEVHHVCRSLRAIFLFLGQKVLEICGIEVMIDDCLVLVATLVVSDNFVCFALS